MPTAEALTPTFGEEDNCKWYKNVLRGNFQLPTSYKQIVRDWVIGIVIATQFHICPKEVILVVKMP